MISKENFVVVYRLNDADSFEFAQYYAQSHGMTISGGDASGTSVDGRAWQIYGQTIGIECFKSGDPDDEIIYEGPNDFEVRVTNIIKSALSRITYTVWGIVLGLNIPGGFIDGADIISSTARISRINFAYSKKLDNPLFNRHEFKRFDAADAALALIVSRIDAPNLLVAKTYVDNAANALSLNNVNGKFYFDPYAGISTDEGLRYTDDLIEFSERTLPLLNMTEWSTTFIDEYTDVIIPFVSGDSCVWSWILDRGTSGFFQPTDTLRAFFYNADYDGGETIRSLTDRRWPFLALNAGYVATASSMSNPTPSGFLQPTPFFQALMRNATIGEAYMFSLPYLDWTVTLFGDPLVWVAFPAVETVDNGVITEDQAWDMMAQDLSRSAAYLYKSSDDAAAIVQSIIDSQDMSMEINMLRPASAINDAISPTNIGMSIYPLAQSLLGYPAIRYREYGLSISSPNINVYLGDKSLTVSRQLTDLFYQGYVLNIYKRSIGSWIWEFQLQQPDSNHGFSRYHFELTISDTSTFTTNLFVIQSWVDYRGWTYEKEPGFFVPLPLDGVGSNLAGRRIRYAAVTSQYLLTRNHVYYFKIREYDELHTTFYNYDPVYSSDIIFT